MVRHYPRTRVHRTSDGTVNEQLTVPNILTASRIAMAVFAAYLAWHGHDGVAVGVCIAAAWLDVFDGWYARTFSRCSSLGKHLDPLADKVLMGVVFVWLGADTASTAVWVLIGLVAVRELGVTLLRVHSLRHRGRFIPASSLGRTKMLAQSVVGLSILSITHFLGVAVPASAVAASLLVILVVSYVSAGGYIRVWIENGVSRRQCGEEPAERGVETRRASAGR